MILRRSTKDLPYYVTLPLGSTATLDHERWNKIEVASPGLLIPHRNDDLTGVADLRFISIRYSNRKPLTQEAGFSESDLGATPWIARSLPSFPGGIVHIWEPGEWWVYISCGQAVPASPTFLQFIFYPNVPELRSIPSELIRSTAHFPGFSSQSLAAGANVKLVSVQELLQGVRGLEVGTNTAGANTRYRWVDAPGAGAFVALASSPYRFEGQYLPLADLWFLNNGAGAITLQRAFYQ